MSISYMNLGIVGWHYNNYYKIIFDITHVCTHRHFGFETSPQKFRNVSRPKFPDTVAFFDRKFFWSQSNEDLGSLFC